MTEGNRPFIVFEGIDGSGKSTIAEMIYQHYESRGIPVYRGAEPSGGKWGREIRALLASRNSVGVKEQLRLFLLDREDDVRNNILPALRDNKMVIMDRYYHSNAAYQGALDQDPRVIIDINRGKGFPEPDRVYLMDIDTDTAVQRISARNPSGETDFFEKKNLLEKIRANYLSFSGPNFLIIDSTLPVPAVFKTVKNDIDTVFFGS
ncbi:MAG TPA: dTMP kinase [Spirochaetota bacterium]|nr:dTMP kinase [Spirochaetota bacterium]